MFSQPTGVARAPAHRGAAVPERCVPFRGCVALARRTAPAAAPRSAGSASVAVRSHPGTLLRVAHPAADLTPDAGRPVPAPRVRSTHVGGTVGGAVTGDRGEHALAVARLPGGHFRLDRAHPLRAAGPAGRHGRRVAALPDRDGRGAGRDRRPGRLGGAGLAGRQRARRRGRRRGGLAHLGRRGRGQLGRLPAGRPDAGPQRRRRGGRRGAVETTGRARTRASRAACRTSSAGC